jgi:hypothetical protein
LPASRAAFISAFSNDKQAGAQLAVVNGAANPVRLGGTQDQRRIIGHVVGNQVDKVVQLADVHFSVERDVQRQQPHLVRQPHGKVAATLPRLKPAKAALAGKQVHKAAKTVVPVVIAGDGKQVGAGRAARRWLVARRRVRNHQALLVSVAIGAWVDLVAAQEQQSARGRWQLWGRLRVPIKTVARMASRST